MNVASALPEIWQVDVNGQIYEGNLEELTQWIAEGALHPQDKVRRGNLRWLEAGKIPTLYGFFNARALGAACPPVVSTTAAEQPQGKTIQQNNRLMTESLATTPAASQNPFVRQTVGQPDAAAPPFNYQNANYQPHVARANTSQPIQEEVADEVKSGANWFFWIAGLSLINSLIFTFGGSWAFITGLAITQVVEGIFDAIASESGVTAVNAVGFLIDLVIAAGFVGFGYFARRGAKWAFIVGMILYGLDGGIYLLTGTFLAVLVHAFALFSLFKGFQFCRD